MNIKNYFLPVTFAIFIAHSAHAHKASMSFTEIAMQPQQLIFTVTFDQEDIVDSDFLAILEQGIEKNSGDVIEKIISLKDSHYNSQLHLLNIDKQDSKVSLVIQLSENVDAITAIFFPIIDYFAHGHRQLVTVFHGTMPVTRHFVHADKRSIDLGSHAGNSIVKSAVSKKEQISQTY